MVHLEANDGAAAFYLLFGLTIFITCLTPVIVTRVLKGMHMPQNIQYQKNQKTQYNKGTFLLAATVVGAGAVCWKIHPTAVEWANASATFEPHEILGVAWTRRNGSSGRRTGASRWRTTRTRAATRCASSSS